MSKSGKSQYTKWEVIKSMPAGSVALKDSFTLDAAGNPSPGPLFIMEKHKVGWNTETGNWEYKLVMPTGAIVGITKGKGSKNVTFCHDCHQAVAEQDYLFFLPEEYRVK